MHQWLPYVMVRAVIFFGAGILAGFYFPYPESESIGTRIFTALVCGYFFAARFRRDKEINGMITGVAGLSALFLGGYLCLLYNTISRDPVWFGSGTAPVVCYTGHALAPEERPNGTRIEIDIDHVYDGAEWHRARGHVLLFITDTTHRLHPEFGDDVVVRGAAHEVKGPMNPDEFDSRDYLRLRNITHQHRITPAAFGILNRCSPYNPTALATRARQWAVVQIRKYIHDRAEQSITEALVLGISAGLDDELMQAYSASGAMHVLSVSGLHVGIVYAILVFFLKPLNAVIGGRWLVCGISLVSLCAYAFVTGLSPSVLRSVMMFSFVAVATVSRRDTNRFNTLAASAFLLLLMDPFLLFSVGFQLSYLAVFGILYCYPRLYALWEPRFKIADKLWQVTSVSLAAQAATFALGLYYFHQFPVYFLFSNLLVIPISTGVLICGIALVAVSPLPILASILAWCTSLLVRLLNGCVLFTEHLPGSVVADVRISVCQCVMLVAVTFLFFVFFERRQFKTFVMISVTGAMFVALEWMHEVANIRREEMTIYDLPGKYFLEIVRDGTAWHTGDAGDDRSFRYHILPHHIQSGVRHNKKLPVISADGVEFLLWSGIKVLRLTRSIQPLAEMQIPETDIVIVGNNAISSIAQLKKKIRFKHLILDSSNRPWLVRTILDSQEARQLSVWALQTKGAFTLKRSQWK